MRFDAYAGNVWGGVPCSEVAEIVAIASQSRVERGRPRGRYSDVFDLKVGADLVGWVGLDQVNEAAYFEFKGTATPEASGAIRKHFGSAHTVSRLDACEDFDDRGAFDSLTRLMDGAKDPRVHSDLRAPRDGDRGRTIYWGSPSSRAMVRVYEAGKMKDRLHYGRPDWTRAEAQIRPGKPAEKVLAATVNPVEAWGFAAWTKRAAEALCQVEVPRFAPTSVPATFDKTTLYLARAFRRHFETMLSDFGDWECVGRELAAVWVADDGAATAMQEALTRSRRGAIDQAGAGAVAPESRPKAAGAA
jgi:hypothetical protein